MRELTQFGRLREDDPLRSPSGRFVLHYDGEGVAVLTDTRTGETTWRAGEEGRPAAGNLLLGNRDEVQVERVDGDRETIWWSGIAASGAQELILTDAGDLELLDRARVRLFNSRTGPVETRATHDSAPAADITADRFLVREDGKLRRTVAREQDGSLRVCEHTRNGGMSYTMSGPLVLWLEQDETVLTWRLLPEDGKPRWWTLCLTDSDGSVLWSELRRNLETALPPAEPHAYGGPELGAGGRLRHQSLTSPSGTHTLVHQEDGDLVLYCNPAHRAVWSTGTWWAGGGWAELTADGDLVVRNPYGAAVWRSGTAGSGERRLVVGDDGRVALRDTGGVEVWAVAAHTSCAEPGTNTARGSVLRRGQTLQRQSLTSADGGTVLVHREDRRLVLHADDGQWIWNACGWDAERSALALDEDGMLRVRAEDGGVALELGGPADELRVLPGEVQLCRADGTVVWRNGAEVAEPEPGTPPAEDADDAEDFESWMDELTGGQAYCATVIHHTTPDEALRRLGAEPDRITTGTWDDLRTQGEIEGVDIDDLVVAAFALGPHTLLVEDNGWTGVNSPQLSQGTFAVSCYMSINADASFVVLRDGEVVADHSDNGSAEPTTPEVQAALDAMGADDPLDAAFEYDLELLCRTAGVRPTVADVTGVARWAIIPGP
ncbi:DUF6461 domain-containing protein [Streptomyces sp. NPDC054765]